MVRLKNELKWFFLSTLYAWGYYALCVFNNPYNPGEIHIYFLLLTSFSVFPILLFVGLPLINGKIALKHLSWWSRWLRVVLYGIMMIFILKVLFNFHIDYFNSRVIDKTFPNGIEAAFKSMEKNLRDSLSAEIEIQDRHVSEPFFWPDSGASFSGMRDTELTLYYHYLNQEDDWLYRYYETYDRKSGKLIETSNSASYYWDDWVKSIEGEYLTEKQEEVSISSTMTSKELGVTLEIYEPYKEYLVKVEEAGPNYIIGKLMSINTDLGKEKVPEAKVLFEKGENGAVNFSIENENIHRLNLKAKTKK